MSRLAAFVLLLSIALQPPAAAAEPATGSSDGRETLSDSTVIDRWTLDNGLRVQTRYVPRTTGVAITVGYGIGSDQDPADREGLAQLLGYLAFTAPAGDVPGRTVQELDSQRPLGWSFPVSRRTTLLTEVATVAQFPGALRQTAERMRGVQVTTEELREAVKQVRRELGEQLFGSPDQSLPFQVREVALGHADEALLRRAAAKGLDGLAPREVEDYLRRLYVPANAVLSIAGNLQGIDVHRLVDGLFADLPAGTRRPDPPATALAPGSRIVMRSGLASPAGVVGVLAPALEDTLHPSFYLTVLLMGTHMSQEWPRASGAAGSRHVFAVLDEPDLARFYPPLRSGETSPDVLGRRMEEAVEGLRGKIVTRETWQGLRARTAWQLGGPMPPDVIATVRQSPILLLNLSRAAAARTLIGGEAFWAEYRRRFEYGPPGASRWFSWFTSPERQIRLLYAPPR